MLQNAFLSRLGLIWSISSMKTSKMSLKKCIFGKKLWKSIGLIVKLCKPGKVLTFYIWCYVLLFRVAGYISLATAYTCPVMLMEYLAGAMVRNYYYFLWPARFTSHLPKLESVWPWKRNNLWRYKMFTNAIT